ncbi:MAG: hypothetical protein A2Z72_01400 [Omnitrophica bacterium RBG_13_46_9]|nr:MAG: hypothetical protein A2Z72_01400 [Omnitrophica bacterium RBG_13_46_9]
MFKKYLPYIRTELRKIFNGKIIAVKGRGGMGNRISAVLTGIVYSRLTKRRLIVDWHDLTYSKRGINAFHQFFTSPDVDKKLEIPYTTSIAPSIWQNRPRRSISSMIRLFGPDHYDPQEFKRRYSIDLSRIDYTEEVLVMFGYRFDWREIHGHFARAPREWRNLDKLSLMRMLLKKHLFPHPSIQRKVDEFKTRYFKGPVIGVHIRYTDNKEHPERTPSIERFPYIIDRLVGISPESRIFLATDNLKILENYHNKYKNVITTEKWHPPGGEERLHSNIECPDRLQNGIEALTDMYLLAQCDYLVYSSTSTFARLVRLLSSLDDSRIFNIERWKIFEDRLKTLSNTRRNP